MGVSHFTLVGCSTLQLQRQGLLECTFQDWAWNRPAAHLISGGSKHTSFKELALTLDLCLPRTSRTLRASQTTMSFIRIWDGIATAVGEFISSSQQWIKFLTVW